MCQLCYAKANSSTLHGGGAWQPRRAFLLMAGAAVAAPALGQVDVGQSSRLRNLVPAAELEQAAAQEYAQLIQQARAKGVLAPDGEPTLERLRQITRRLIPHAVSWNERARGWRWEANLIRSDQINAFVMPGGKMAVYTGLPWKLQLTDDELAMVVAHEMAHALREHARERIAKTQGTGIGLSVLAQILGLGELGNMAADVGTQLLSLRFSREDETEADLVGLEIAARAGFNPEAALSLWEKMGRASGGSQGPAFLSTHPSGPERMARLRQNIPRVRGLYEQAVRSGGAAVGDAGRRPPASAGIPIIR
ncbi:M48 family metallopeptidase [Ramlibacter sp. AW1]|uniref:M48 family metallopeptidase n=1 Tax=Ramlibacter aurantiacus TaxID=2801330 RepID=A0A936ZH65_9BURK|nr:M48 family metallopeptidase [Ramlibacter aurantiacus]MBL0421359.1 M48 family metallopeptidase [Ramlibacter aurantiacus]